MNYLIIMVSCEHANKPMDSAWVANLTR